MEHDEGEDKRGWEASGLCKTAAASRMREIRVQQKADAACLEELHGEPLRGGGGGVWPEAEEIEFPGDNPPKTEMKR